MAVTARPTLAPMPSLANELPDCPTTKWSVDNIDIAAEQVSCVNVFLCEHPCAGPKVQRCRCHRRYTWLG